MAIHMASQEAARPGEVVLRLAVVAPDPQPVDHHALRRLLKDSCCARSCFLRLILLALGMVNSLRLAKNAWITLRRGALFRLSGLL